MLESEAAETRRRLHEKSEELRELEAALEGMTARAEQAEEFGQSVEVEIARYRQEEELTKLRIIAEETRKWEGREARLVWRIEELEHGEPAYFTSTEVSTHVEAAVSSEENQRKEQAVTVDTASQRERARALCTPTPAATPAATPPATPTLREVQTDRVMAEHRTAVTQPLTGAVPNPMDAFAMAVLAQQLPSLPNFSGDRGDGEDEDFDDWIGRLELVASTCKWGEQAKLINVATRLCGSASHFYRSCTPQQRSSYPELTSVLRKRFTPVRIQSVQSGRFHEHKQSSTETVHNYAQDLRKLFYHAYSGSVSQYGGGGAERMGRSILAYQFVSGLVDALKVELVGREGTFEELLAKARFEEAKLWDVIRGGKANQLPRVPAFQTRGVPQRTFQPRTDRKCFNCGGAGHFARDCTLRGRGAPLEAQGRGSFQDFTNNPRNATSSNRPSTNGINVANQV